MSLSLYYPDLWGLSEEQRSQSYLYYATVIHAMIEMTPLSELDRKPYHDILHTKLNEARASTDPLYELDQCYEAVMRMLEFYHVEYQVHEPLTLQDTPEQRLKRMHAFVQIVSVLLLHQASPVWIKDNFRYIMKLRRGFLVRLERLIVI